MGFLPDMPAHIHPVETNIVPIWPSFEVDADGRISEEARQYERNLYCGIVPDGFYAVLPNFVCPLVERALDEKRISYRIYSHTDAFIRYMIDDSESMFYPKEVRETDVPLSVIVTPKQSGCDRYGLLHLAETEWGKYTALK